MNKGGLCESCIRPGKCCHDLFLTSFGPPDTRGKDMQDPMSFEAAEHFMLRAGLPFRPLRQNANGSWSFWCPALEPATGRCSIYETRPDPCVSYLPGSSDLCIHCAPSADEQGDRS